MLELLPKKDAPADAQERRYHTCPVKAGLTGILAYLGCHCSEWAHFVTGRVVRDRRLRSRTWHLVRLSCLSIWNVAHEVDLEICLDCSLQDTPELPSFAKAAEAGAWVQQVDGSTISWVDKPGVGCG